MKLDIITISNPILINENVVVIGRIGYDLYADQKNTPLDKVESFSRYLGGSAANIAVGLARLNVPTSIISVISDDCVGGYLREFLENEKIDCRGIRAEANCNNSLSLVEIAPPSNFNSIFYRKDCADLRIQYKDIDLNKLNKAKILITTGTSLSGNPSRDSILFALMKHKTDDNINVFDLDYRSTLWEDSRTANIYLRLAISLSDIIFGTREELEIVCESRDLDDIALEIKNLGPKIVVAKLGGKGAVIYGENEKIEFDPYEINVVSTLGAGDSFAASFCFGILQKWALRECGAFANAGGALVASRLTCSTAMPSFMEINNFIHSKTEKSQNINLK